MTYAIIPAKSFTGAKQRLATFLQPHERRVLARAMLTDTLTAYSQVTGLDGVGVVTCERDVADVAAALGAEVLWEPQAQGHSQAVAFGIQVCRQRGITAMRSEERRVGEEGRYGRAGGGLKKGEGEQ